MSINLAFGNALSGLGATARMAEVVSANLANALTEGYARRSVDLSAASLDGRGAGVRIDGVTRNLDRSLLAERRGAETALGERKTLAAALRGLEGDLGATDGGTDLAARLQQLEGALASASADPSSDTRLGQVLDRLSGVTRGLNDAATAVQRRRAEADGSIARQVGDLNDALQGIARLNRDIVAARGAGRDAAGLMDQRQLLMDKVAAIVPVREMDRAGGAVALVTPKGALLLDDGRAATVGFTATPVIGPGMTLASGALGGLTLNGESLGPDGVGRLAGGSLGAAFALRDRELPESARQLDDLARSLIERFEDPATDPTLGTSPALLTDAGARLDPTRTEGLAQRVAVNPRVDPDRGGALSRLRDGVQAVTPGPTGESAQIDRWLDALQAPLAPASGGRPGSAASLASAVTADVGRRRLAAEEDESFANARWSTLKESELAQGVDSDRELQLLLQLEKAYAANARVITALDEMMRTVLEM